MDMDNQLFVDPQSTVDEGRLYGLVLRWLFTLSLRRIFENLKSFLREPSILGAIPMLLLSIPSAVVFHFFFNKIGLAFRSSFIFSMATPFVILLSCYIIYRYVHESTKSFMLNFIFTRMVAFTFPTSLFKTPQKNFNTAPHVVIHAVKSNDKIIKFYGLKQLQNICSGTPQDRKMIYSLSQPGCHPRNWMTFRDVAIELINNVRDHLHHETRSRTIQTTFLDKSHSMPNVSSMKGNVPSALESPLMNRSNNSSIVLNELYEGKQSFFVPPTLKPYAPDQFLCEVKRQNIRLPFFLDGHLEKIRQYLFRPRFITTYDTLCTLLAIKALTNVIIHSLAEDQFGVIQKDLKLCLSALARLSIAIDAFVRATTRTCKTNAYNNFNIHILDEELATSLKAIRFVFGQYISELDLSPTELEVFRVLV